MALESLKVNSSSSSSGGSELISDETPVILDSGTTLTYLPPRVARQIYQAFDAVDDTRATGLVYVSCDLLSSEKNTTIDFQFGNANGPVVRVPIDELVLDNVKGYVSIGLELPDLPFDDPCSFGIQSLSGIYLLGDTFLRSAYVVYDLTNKKIALAQANLNATETNIMEITSSGIPLVSGVAAQETPSKSSSSGSSSGNHSGNADNSGTDSDQAGESTTDSAAPRTVPALNWEAGAVMLVATLFSIAGASLFAL